MAISCSASVKSDGKVNYKYEANSKNRAERSAAHAQFSSVIMAITCSAKIKSDAKVNRNNEANTNNGVERSAAHTHVSSVIMAIAEHVSSVIMAIRVLHILTFQV